MSYESLVIRVMSRVREVGSRRGIRFGQCSAILVSFWIV